MTKVALYPRVSSVGQEDNFSIPEQIERMQAFCTAKGYEVYKIYSDTASGATTDRPGLQAMLSDIEAGKITHVMVYKLDRLSRSQLDTLTLIKKFEEHGVTFSSITEGFDTTTEMGRFIVGILAVFAEMERGRIRERTRGGKDQRARTTGKWHGSKWYPIGYDYIDGSLVINEYEAMQIREIAEMFLDLVPVRQIATTMNNKGYKTKYGEWHAKAVRRVLSNPVSYGYITLRGEVLPGEHDAILDEGLRDRIMVIMDERKAEHGNKKTSIKCLLGGMIYCAHCTGKYSYRSNGGGKQYYTCYSRNKAVPAMIKDPNCKNKIYKAEELEGAILGEIKKLAIDPAYVDQVRENKPVNNAAEKAKAISAEIAKVDSQISKMMDLYALGTIDIDAINDKVASLSSTKSRLTAELDSLAVPADDEVMTTKQIRDMAGLIKKAKTTEQKREVIASLIYSIEIDGENVTIHWKF